MRRNTEKSVVYHEVQEDYRTGEVIQRRTVVRQAMESEYIKIYLNSTSKIDRKAIDKCLTPIMFCILNEMSYCEEDASKSQIVKLQKNERATLGHKMDVSESRIYQLLKDLVSAGIMKRTQSCEYQINPYVFGKGKWFYIKKLRLSPLWAEYNDDDDCNDDGAEEVTE